MNPSHNILNLNFRMGNSDIATGYSNFELLMTSMRREVFGVFKFSRQRHGADIFFCLYNYNYIPTYMSITGIFVSRDEIGV